MLVTDAISPDLWIARGPREDEFFSCGYFKGTAGYHHFVIGRFIGIETRIIQSRAFVTYHNEVYKTEMWGGDPEKILKDLVFQFSKVSEPCCPVELVYLYGGTINHEAVTIVPQEGVH